MNTFPWNIFFILFTAGLLGTAAVLPYALAMNPKAMEKLKEAASAPASEDGQPVVKGKRNMPFPVLILISILQTVVLISIATFVGLLVGKQTGLGTPILQAALENKPVAGLILEMLPATILLGLAAGIVMLVLEWTYFMPRIPRELSMFDYRTPFWKRVLACFYGGMDEEIFMRLFMMGSLVWLLGLVWKTPENAPAVGAFWLANILAALLFGAGHLPATAGVTRLTPVVVMRGLILNGIPGLVFGYLYMRYGLEAAMLSHFSLDILLHLIAPVISEWRGNTLPPESVVQPG
jgi:hypothetical protein